MKEETNNKVLKIFKELLPYIIIIVVVVLIRTFFVTPVRVDGDSMYPTLKDNDIMILNKNGKLKRYKIVVLDYKEERLIKRLYGLPGETLEIKDGKILIDDKELEDDYGYGNTWDLEKVELDKNECFVIGDNREVSGDSRYFGAVKCDEIEGTTSYTIFPFNRWGSKK